ncbi:HpcH/HpaI aldolase/citrate lyase family protein [Saccharata proteae CBS 121410]|uniref:HpcH/HpaI aldolase/citrate lyase family protein n=1 Tax=Saccharata proteae CBS 121410 TaxID=1314787 RepID=A0A9P4HR88_9PEZI|nr:HpcH/HpaI aldolase/citrate lyase family protein [Saccharata proteae CBS 121410]
MQSANRLHKALKKGGATFGGWQMLPGTNHARAIARCNMDWICVDTEHGNIDDGQMHEAVAAIASCGVSPVVRIAANETWMVKRALDSGAHGIIVPLLYTAADARALVSAAKFPPVGTRGFGSPFPMGTFSNQSSTQYLQEANDALITIVQIETKEALENVDEIARVEGVDVLLIGPFDLGNNIGYPVLDGVVREELGDAIARIHKAAVDNGKRTGIYCTSGEQGREYADKGFHMISIAADMIAIPAYFTNALSAAKGSLAHSAMNMAKGAVSGAAKMTGPYGK